MLSLSPGPDPRLLRSDNESDQANLCSARLSYHHSTWHGEKYLVSDHLQRSSARNLVAAVPRRTNPFHLQYSALRHMSCIWKRGGAGTPSTVGFVSMDARLLGMVADTEDPTSIREVFLYEHPCTRFTRLTSLVSKLPKVASMLASAILLRSGDHQCSHGGG